MSTVVSTHQTRPSTPGSPSQSNQATAISFKTGTSIAVWRSAFVAIDAQRGPAAKTESERKLPGASPTANTALRSLENVFLMNVGITDRTESAAWLTRISPIGTPNRSLPIQTVILRFGPKTFCSRNVLFRPCVRVDAVIDSMPTDTGQMNSDTSVCVCHSVASHLAPLDLSSPLTLAPSLISL